MSREISVQLYRWADGSAARLVSYPVRSCVYVDFVGGTAVDLRTGREVRHPAPTEWSFEIHLRNGRRVVEYVLPFDDVDEETPLGEDLAKLLGLFLDLGAEHSVFRGTWSTSLVERTADAPPFAPYPRWVDDRRWEGRYEEADAFYTIHQASKNIWSTKGIPTVFLGFVEHLQIRPPSFSESNVWSAVSLDGTCSNPTFHGVVDEVIRDSLLMPTSSRRAWEAEHVIHGELLFPPADEVMLFSAMGEDPPFWWPPEKLLPYLEQRGSP